MRRTPLIVMFGLMLATLISTLTISPAQAEIQTYNWIGATYEGHDGFYGTYVVAYEAGSEGTLAVAVHNDLRGPPPEREELTANISAVGVRFDWMTPGTYINSTECNATNPYELEYCATHTFIVQFTVPTTPTTLNLVTHSYDIIVVTQDVIWTEHDDNFAVLSADQAYAIETAQKWGIMYNAFNNYAWNSIEARVLWMEAQVEANTGASSYTYGDFAGAKTHYQTAINLADQAIYVETERQAAFDSAELNTAEAQANYFNSQANATMTEAEAAMKKAGAAMTQAYAWMLFGVGWILIGVGAIVYAVRKTRIPQSGKTHP